MSEGEQVLTRSEAAMLLQACLEKVGWAFSLDRTGRLHLVIGATPPRVPQAALLELLGMLAPEFQTLLRAQRTHRLH